MRRIAALLGIVALAACEARDPVDQATKDLGDFRLCQSFAYFAANDPGPLSRKATAEEWETAITEEIERRFGRYDGPKCYYVSAAIEGYGLAQPGVPLVFSPKSGLVLRAFVFDGELDAVLNKGGERIEVFLAAKGGLTNTREEQLTALARTGIARIEQYMLDHPEWFDGDSNAEIVAESLAEFEARRR